MSAAKNRLVVFVPGLDLSVRRCRALLDQLQKDRALREPVAEWLAFDRFLFRMGLRRLTAVADDLAARINQRWITSGGFDEIILVGHSVGGLLVRQAYLIAVGASSDEEKYAWASAVTRIVLLAAPNRGVSKLSLVNAVGDWFARVFLFFGHFTYQDLLAGSTFVTNLRLEWIRYFRSLPSSASVPLVIQLLGTNDDIVKQTDSQDVLAFQNSVTIKLSGATHGNIAVLPQTKGMPTDEAREWAEIIRRSILGTPESLGLVAETSPAPRDEASSATRIVFVLHGIRARDIDQWLSEVEAEIHRRDPSAKIIRPRYGYFTALRFVLPSVRRRNIRHLQDLYAEHLAENPRAEFHFIGHSNGTYMFGRSLSEIPAMRFERVVLAGSVLPVDLFRPESALLRQVTAVRSDCGQLDWPVGILCRVLNKVLMMRDVGTAGYDGFIGDFVTEVRYHAGGHGSMFTVQNVKSMVRFILEGESDPPTRSLVREDERFRMKSLAAPYFVRAILLVILLVPVVPHGPNWLHWYIGVAVGVLLAVIVLDII